MKRPKRDPVREDRIHNEAIADANGPEEQVMGWHCYLDDKIRFPFQAKCIAVKVVSPLRKGETVEVLRMAPEDACLGGHLKTDHRGSLQNRPMEITLDKNLFYLVGCCCDNPSFDLVRSDTVALECLAI
jgi:hypothetical protein